MVEIFSKESILKELTNVLDEVMNISKREEMNRIRNEASNIIDLLFYNNGREEKDDKQSHRETDKKENNRGDSKRIWNESKNEYIPIEILKKSFGLVINFELPGVKQSDIDLSVNDTSVTVSVVKITDSTSPHDIFYSERNYGTFEKTVFLPKDVKSFGKVHATFANGVLSVTLVDAFFTKRNSKVEIEVS